MAPSVQMFCSTEAPCKQKPDFVALGITHFVTCNGIQLAEVAGSPQRGRAQPSYMNVIGGLASSFDDRMFARMSAAC
jgi:hypothetical protein